MENKEKKQKGFTLIEMIVVMAVFLFVIGAAITIFISIISHQREILAEQQFLSQISYAEEHMSKALRMARVETGEGCLLDGSGDDHPGYIYLLTHFNAGEFGGIKFINQSEDNGACQEFFLDGSGTDADPYILKEIINSGAPVALTSAKMKIKFIRFSVDGSDGTTSPYNCQSPPTDCGASSADTVQPRVTILLDVSIPGDTMVSRIIQTTVSQRNLNVQLPAE